MVVKKYRFDFIDVARGIGILLMVMGHCDNTGSISAFVNLFHMSLFVFLSGYLFKNRQLTNFQDLVKYLGKRILKLYVFYLFFEILFYLCTNLFLDIGFYDSSLFYGGKQIFYFQSFSEAIIHILKIVFLMGREPFCGAFWFIITLIFVTSFYAFLNYLSSKQKFVSSSLFVFIGCLLFFAIGSCMNAWNVSIPRISSAFTFMIVYYLGNWWFLSKKSNQMSIWFHTILFLISIILLYFLNNIGFISMNSNTFPNFAFFLLASFCGIYAVMYLAKGIVKTKFLKTIFITMGQRTLSIMAFHFLSFKIAAYIQYLVGDAPYIGLAYLTGYNNNNAWYILYVIVGVLVPILISYIYDFVKKKMKVKVKL